jgi:putative endonuclease
VKPGLCSACASEENPAVVSFVYLLRCRDGSLYTGIARDLERRVEQHRAGTASKYTRSRRPLRLVWFVRVRTWSEALRLELKIKQLTRTEKLGLLSPPNGHGAAVPRVPRLPSPPPGVGSGRAPHRSRSRYGGERRQS